MLDFSEETIRHIIRAIWGLIIATIWYFLNSITRRIGSQRAEWLLRRASFGLLIFFGCLLTGFVIDAFLGFEIGWFGATVNLSFWGSLAVFVYLVDRRLKNQPKEIHSTAGDLVENPKYIDTNAVANLLEDLLDALKIQQSKSFNLRRKMQRTLPK